jgi:endonuclease/exonuclease/phosphatase family metal-dependent hydrolase
VTPGAAVALHAGSGAPNAAWRAAAGPPLSRDAPAADGAAGTLALLSWNVWIGRGRLREVVTRVRDGAYAAHGLPAGTPIVVLLQEAYRAGEAVPAAAPPGTAPRTQLRGTEEDVADTAAALGLSLRYAPSMRNGRHRSDRGNAILATLPLHDAQAVELPFVYQRRVALSAAVEVTRPGGTRVRLRVCTAHLDPRGPAARDFLGVAGRGRQADGLLAHLDALPREPQLIGADLNLARGTAEPAFRRLKAAGFAPGLPPAFPAWSHTFHRWPRLLLDWIVARDPDRALGGVVVRRLDEREDDRGMVVFGSDHHPLLARVDLAAG